MLVMLLGDSHGNLAHLRAALRGAREAAMQAGGQQVVCVHLGDFGFWPGIEGKWFLDSVLELVKETSVKLWVIDGNHDYPGRPGDSTAMPQGYTAWSNNDPVATMPDFCHLPRGTVFELGGKTFGVLGGGVSIDRLYRKKGVSWWPEEAITEDQVAGVADQEVDIMLAHDAPAIPPGKPAYFDDRDSTLHTDLLTATNRVWQVLCKWRPKLVVHGHWHYHYETVLPLPDGQDSVRVVGLAEETLEGGIMMLQLPGDR